MNNKFLVFWFILNLHNTGYYYFIPRKPRLKNDISKYYTLTTSQNQYINFLKSLHIAIADDIFSLDNKNCLILFNVFLYVAFTKSQ